jgi:hypothetical protein
MHRYRPSMISIALLFVICLFSACTSSSGPVNQAQQMPAPNATQNMDVGVVPVNTNPSLVTVSFDEARHNLKNSEGLSLNQQQIVPRVLFIQGGSLDESGNAVQWVFGVSKGDTNELRVYDKKGWTILTFPNTIPADEIDLGNIVSPATLFDHNKDQILGSSSSAIPVQRDLELRNGTYTITITSGSTSQILMFNATTGAAIE